MRWSQKMPRSENERMIAKEKTVQDLAEKEVRRPKGVDSPRRCLRAT